MSVEAIVAPAPPARPELRHLALRGVAWALLGSCLALLAVLLVAGERTTSYDALRAAVAGGTVDHVRVVGSGRAAEVHWRSGVLGRVTETDGAARTIADLRAIEPDLVIDRDPMFTGHSEAGAWRAPSWTLIVVLVVQVGAIGLLVLGPEPRWATGWAWFWLLWFAFPLGTLACLWSSSTARWGARGPERRLTGGWAFLVMCFGAAVVGSVATALV